MASKDHSEDSSLPSSEGKQQDYPTNAIPLPTYESSSFICHFSSYQPSTVECQHGAYKQLQADELFQNGHRTSDPDPSAWVETAKNTNGTDSTNRFTTDPPRRGWSKWIPPKTRLLRKLNKSGNFSDDSTTRVCSNCNTTKTPLWRGGPQGPKSLCNACGIRQRKARKAMAAAEALSGGLMISKETTTKVISKGKRSHVGNYDVVPYKKRCTFSSIDAPEKLRLDDLGTGSNRSLDFHRVLAQDEREAAILLMALSSDVICGSIG